MVIPKDHNKIPTERIYVPENSYHIATKFINNPVDQKDVTHDQVAEDIRDIPYKFTNRLTLSPCLSNIYMYEHNLNISAIYLHITRIFVHIGSLSLKITRIFLFLHQPN